MTDPLDGSAPSPGKADAVEASSAGPAAARVRLRWFLLACAVAAGAVLIGQGSKALALAQLSSARMTAIPLLGDWLGLQLAFNPGTVMSLGSDSTWLLTVIATAASIALLIAAARAPSAGWAVAIVGRGHVTDFLAYGNLFIGNLADVILGFGVALGVLLYLRGPNHTRNGQ